MRVLAIDPGTEASACLLYDTSAPTYDMLAFERRPIVEMGIFRNEDVLSIIDRTAADVMAVEMIASYGMPVGRETFETCLWIGRFVERRSPAKSELVYRMDVKLHLCGQARAKDPNVRQALIDRFGPGQEKAIGTVKNQGPLYGIKSHIWSALAVAVTYCERAEREAKRGAA